MDSFINFFDFYWNRLNKDLVFQTEVIKGIITGIVAFGFTFVMFLVTKGNEKRKEKYRIKDVRNSLFYCIEHFLIELKTQKVDFANYLELLRKQTLTDNVIFTSQFILILQDISIQVNAFSKTDLMKILIIDNNESKFVGTELYNNLVSGASLINNISNELETSYKSYQEKFDQFCINFKIGLNNIYKWKFSMAEVINAEKDSEVKLFYEELINTLPNILDYVSPINKGYHDTMITRIFNYIIVKITGNLNNPKISSNEKLTSLLFLSVSLKDEYETLMVQKFYYMKFVHRVSTSLNVVFNSLEIFNKYESKVVRKDFMK